MSVGPEAPTLLVVDDEERILSALRRALRREGWRILATSDPLEAVRWLENEPVGAVLSDHKMRGMSGLELLEAAARLRPAAARFLITGWPDAIPGERLAALGLRALIPKPWEDATLKGLLREALER
ncbi:MAG: response regulator [Deltaproteobacteria bacterium]|nr:response regulator [Deltaproteobacteria bacterium]